MVVPRGEIHNSGRTLPRVRELKHDIKIGGYQLSSRTLPRVRELKHPQDP